jgi:hypothetical protein
MDEFPSDAGLCKSCIHARLITSQKQSRFVMCGYSAKDRRFPKYPVLPVRTCSGHTPRSSEGAPTSDHS